MEEKLSKGLTGIAGEYYVAAELSLRGYMTSVLLRNNDSVDILAYDLKNNRPIAIQVKTNQYGKPKWPLNKKVEKLTQENLFYVFVLLKTEKKERPDFYIVPGKLLAEKVKTEFLSWFNQPGKKGQQRNDSGIRTFVGGEQYLENWDLLKR